nr:hypothetical protein [uncultured Campylobacter sp.]
MGTHKRLKFKPDEYLLKGIERKFKERFGKVRFRDDVARANTAREGINMICIRGYRTISQRESSRVSTAQIALNRPAAARRAGIGAAKKAATRANIGGASGKALQCRNCKGDDDASTSCKSKTINSCAVVARKRRRSKAVFNEKIKFQKGEK